MQQEKARYLRSPDGSAIYDSVTSLTWLAQDSRLELERDVSWQEAHGYAKTVNARQPGGHGDWRLPSLQEASTLFDRAKLNKDFKGADIHLDSIFPPGGGNCTWTTSTRGNKEAQIIFYVNGFAYWYELNDKTISHAVRLVRRD